jgi:hypothetical protein
MSTTDLVINPQEYKLSQEESTLLQKDFVTSKLELEGFVKVYEHLINSELNDETAKQASEVRKKLVKVRTGTDKIRKSLKDYHLNAGRFIDALAKVIETRSTQMESTLADIENYKQIQLAKEQEALRVKRLDELKEFDANLMGIDLGVLSEQDYANFKNICEIAFNDRKAKEKEASELLHKQTIFSQRERTLLPYSTIVDITSLNINSTEEQYQLLLDKCITAKKVKDAEIEIMSKELEEVKKSKVVEVVVSTIDVVSKEVNKEDNLILKDKLLLEHYKNTLKSLNDIQMNTNQGIVINNGLKAMNTKVLDWLENKIKNFA